MDRSTWRTALVSLALVTAACGSSENATGGELAAKAETPTAAEVVTTIEAPLTTIEAPTTTVETTTAAETTTTAAPAAAPGVPPVGTGVLTVGGVDFPFTIETCNTEPALSAVSDSILLFEVRGSTVAEDQPAQVSLFRSESASGQQFDSFGWGYALDRNDFETLRSESTPFGLSDHITVEQADGATTFYGSLTPFVRTEGISVLDDVDPGMGSIVATC